jgi:hypothetical protein
VKKLAYAVLTAAMAGGLALSSVGTASAAHRYNVETGNGECKPTSASATDNANDPEAEQSENSKAGQQRAAERSPAISGDGGSKTCE